MLAIKYESLQKQNDDLRKVDENAAAVQRLKWENRVARRAAKAAGFVEQAASAQTEYDAINALANYEANRHTKSYIVLRDWIHAIDIFRFETAQKIFDKDWIDEEPFTVGEYLELSEKLKPACVECDCGEEITAKKSKPAMKIIRVTCAPNEESYADTARKIGDFWQFAFTFQNRKQYTENCAEKNVL